MRENDPERKKTSSRVTTFEREKSNDFTLKRVMLDCAYSPKTNKTMCRRMDAGKVGKLG